MMVIFHSFWYIYQRVTWIKQSDIFGSFFRELICVLAVGCSPDRDVLAESYRLPVIMGRHG